MIFTLFSLSLFLFVFTFIGDKIIAKLKLEELMGFGKENPQQNAASINRALFKLSK